MYIFIHIRSDTYTHTHFYMHLHTYFFDHIHTDNIHAYSTYKCNHINLVFMIDISHHSFVELCIPDKLVGCMTWIGAWQPWVIDSYWLKSLPATTAGIILSLKWVFIPECRPHLVPVRQSPTSTRQIHSCFYHMPKVVPFHMPRLDWELQLWRGRCLIPFLPTDVREVVVSVNGWTWVDYLWRAWSVSKMCCETTIENWSTWWNFQWSTELQNFHQNSSKGTVGSQESHEHLQNHATHVFSQSAFGRKALIPAACFPKLSIAYAECAFGLESKLTLLNPVCQYGAFIACGSPHGAGDCRKSGWGHHPSAMSSLFVLGSSRQILLLLKRLLPGRVL